MPYTLPREMRKQWHAFIILVWVLYMDVHCVEFQPRMRVSAGPESDILTPPVGAPQVGRDEWDAFLRDNLGKDIEPWQARAPLNPADIALQYQAIVNGTGLSEQIVLILIYNNKIYYPTRADVNNTEPPALTCPHGMAFHRKVSFLLASGRRNLPNALFVYSFEDNRPRYCSPSSEYCRRVPLVNQIKTVGEADGDDLDILVPQWMYTPNQLFLFPWHLKKDIAFFRGEPFCSEYWTGRYRCHDACPRTCLAQLAARDVQAGNASVLDVGMVERVERPLGPDGETLPYRCLKMDLPVLPRMPIAGHSHYKWLLHLEGITASSRLSQLMLVNSVVVMQRQPFIEYFYRSLRPYVHFVPFWNATGDWEMADIYEVVADLRRRDAADPEGVQRMVRESQSFALKFTMPASRLQYLKDALTAYRSLFPNMDAFLEEYVAEMRGRGFPI